VDAPPAVHAQLNELTKGLRTTLGDALVGVYVHGSLALGCFNGARSDIDVLAIVARTLSQDERQAVVDVLLQTSGAPFGVEADVLTIEQLRNWRHPSPFELHFWEGRRDEWALDPLGTHASLATENPDLAAHLKIARAAGIALIGPPPAEVFPLVPEADLRDSLLRDLEWSRTAGVLYGVLSPCRIWAALETGEIHSKVTGARWAIQRLPADLQSTVERALAAYTGTGEPIEVDEKERRRLLDHIAGQLGV
jgi:streptomycin 3"-adenylyltransferase